MADVSEAEVQAEAQLTSRYWMFLAEMSRAVSHVVAAKVQVAALAVRTFVLQGIHSRHIRIAWKRKTMHDLRMES